MHNLFNECYKENKNAKYVAAILFFASSSFVFYSSTSVFSPEGIQLGYKVREPQAIMYSMEGSKDSTNMKTNKTEKFHYTATFDRTKFDPDDDKWAWNKFPVRIDPACLRNLPPKAPTFPEQDIAFLNTLEGKEYKKILAYHYAYGRHYGFGLGRKPFEVACCKEKRCFMTDKRDQIPFTDFDAVIIHFRNFKHKNLPKQRSPEQRWIFFEREPPTLSSKNPEQYEGVFNWTMTYRRDSDIYSNYGNLYPKAMVGLKKTSENSEILLNLHIETKTKLVAWLVSHCKTPSKREDYVKRLQKYIEVDVYGKCGPHKCHKTDRDFCYKWFEKNYKFYLSFENSFCKDYVTEKFFNIFKYNLVPVVRGSADYASIAPPHSYIDAKDFDSEKALADYLLYLDRNDTAYKEYFWWKQDFSTISVANWMNKAMSFCDLCEKLHNDNATKVYHNLAHWFVRGNICSKT